MNVDFHKIDDSDFDFLWQLHNAALKDYVAQTWGWDENWQKHDFAENFNPEKGEIILIDGKDGGFLWTIDKENETLLVSIRLLPEFQNKGIGSKIIRNLLDKSRKPVKLQVLKVNPARRFYQRLGFKICEETATHFVMKTKQD
jgi:GNAT superfamily N-acetyltransferase